MRRCSRAPKCVMLTPECIDIGQERHCRTTKGTGLGLSADHARPAGTRRHNGKHCYIRIRAVHRSSMAHWVAVRMYI